MDVPKGRAGPDGRRSIPRSVSSSVGSPGRTPATGCVRIGGELRTLADPGRGDDDPEPAPDRASGSRPATHRSLLDLSPSGPRRVASSPVTSSASRRRGSGRSMCWSSSSSGSRRIHLSASTAHPDSAWVTQQGRNLALELDDRSAAIRFLIRDRDTKFTRAFDEVVRSEGARVILSPIRAPNATASAARVSATIRAEGLDWSLSQRAAPARSNSPDGCHP